MLPLHEKIWSKGYHDFQLRNGFVFFPSVERSHFQRHYPETKEAESIFLNTKLEAEVVQMARFLLFCVFDMAFFGDNEPIMSVWVLLVGLRSHLSEQLKCINLKKHFN